jgi:hypothetical protein
MSAHAVDLADTVCHLTGEQNRRGVLRLAGQYFRQRRQREAAHLGYLDLGEAGC